MVNPRSRTVLVLLVIGCGLVWLWWEKMESQRVQDAKAARKQEKIERAKGELAANYEAITFKVEEALVLLAFQPFNSAELHGLFVREDNRPILLSGKLVDVGYIGGVYICVFEVSDFPFNLTNLVLLLQCEEEIANRLLRDRRSVRDGYAVVAQVSSVEWQVQRLGGGYELSGQCLDALLIAGRNGE